MKFILNVESIKGTKILKYIELATKEKAPEVYKPRQGKVNNNKSKFLPQHLDFIHKNAEDLLNKLGYAHLFDEDEKAVSNTTWIQDFNERNHKLSMKNFYESDEIMAIECNDPGFLLRKNCPSYPEGRMTKKY